MKRYIILISIIIIIGILIFNNKIEKFYLEDKYYTGSDFIKIDSIGYDQIKDESYIMYVYNNYCPFPVSCESIFKEYMDKYKISFISMSIGDFNKISLHDKVKYAPTVILVNKGNIIDYLDSNDDKDLNKYQDIIEFEKWINKYIELK